MAARGNLADDYSSRPSGLGVDCTELLLLMVAIKKKTHGNFPLENITIKKKTKISNGYHNENDRWHSTLTMILHSF